LINYPQVYKNDIANTQNREAMKVACPAIPPTWNHNNTVDNPATNVHPTGAAADTDRREMILLSVESTTNFTTTSQNKR